MLTQNYTQHKQLLSEKAAQIDRLNAEIQELSNIQKQEADSLSVLQQRAKTRSDRTAKITNLRRLVEDRRRPQQARQHSPQKISPGEAEQHAASIAPLVDAIRQLPPGHPDLAETALTEMSSPQLKAVLTSLSIHDLNALHAAYEANNANLSTVSSTLQKRSTQLELLYRKVVSLCTSVPEDRVEESLPLLVAAVESERGSLGREEAGRVREFLVKVEGVRGSGVQETPRKDGSHSSQGRGLMGPPQLPV